MTIQLIDRKQLLFRINNKEYYYVKPYYLMHGLSLTKAVVKGSTLCWNIQGGIISYNQIKKALRN